MFPARLRLFEENAFKDFSLVEDAEAYCRELKEAENCLSHPADAQHLDA